MTPSRLIEWVATLPDDRAVFAAGDFNTTSTDDRDNDLLDRYVRPHWAVSNDYYPSCSGTSYYAVDGTWSVLDMILWKPYCGARATWDLAKNPVEIANQTNQQVAPDGTPRRFDLPKRVRCIRPLPVVLRIESK